MKIDRSSWHYKVAMWDKTLYSKEPRTLCAYVNRILLTLFIMMILAFAWIVFHVILVIAWIPVALAALTLGVIPDRLYPGEWYKKYQPLRVSRIRIYPFDAFALTMLAKLVWFFVSLIDLYTTPACVLVAIVLGGMICYVRYGMLAEKEESVVRDELDTSTLTFWRVTIEFLRAKKQRVCPFIEYTTGDKK